MLVGEVVDLEDWSQRSREIVPCCVGVSRQWECPKVLHFFKIQKLESTDKAVQPSLPQSCLRQGFDLGNMSCSNCAQLRLGPDNNRGHLQSVYHVPDT